MPQAVSVTQLAPFTDQAPDTIRVDSSTFMLATRIYYNIVTLQRDTVYLFDAQTNEARARADSVWIGKLFPGRHPVVLVVTDLAWPHISGVRFWVAMGAKIIVHEASRAFVAEVIARRWQLHPDALEQRRHQVHAHLTTVSTAMSLAGGRIELRPIDGVGSEGALMAYIPASRFLYAGDFIQPGNTGAPIPGFIQFTYMDEVAAAVKRNGFAPELFAAMHVKPTPWSAVVTALAR